MAISQVDYFYLFVISYVLVGLLTPSEVAALFRVDPKTVTRWAKAGKLTSIRTLGGHRRYKESEVKALLKAITPNTSTNQVGTN